MIITKELAHLLSTQKRKDARDRIKKVYNGLLYKKGNKRGYFECPSAYLKKISGQYNLVIKLLLEHKIIEYQSFNTEEKDIFNLRRKKYYNTENGNCIRYKFIIDIEDGIDDNEVRDYSELYKDEKWYIKTRYSLLELGYKEEELLIKRDNFSRRLHTNITGFIPHYKTYKELMSGGEYYVIDSKTSQPRILWLSLKDIGLQDDNLNYIFENGIDFYDYILDRIPAINDRKDAKELFTSWINGTGYLDAEKSSIRDIFPVANTFLRKYKTQSYKNACRLLQYKEASIFIDDLLNNAPVNFCLSVHDSLLIKEKDIDIMLDYCKSKYPDLIFTIEKIKNK